MLPDKKGKRKIINLLSPSSSDVNNSDFQRLLKRINNCKATYWKCGQCTVKQLSKCIDSVRQHYQMKAFLKYKDDPEYRKAMAKKGINMQRM